jgi:hypothetical protein
MVYQTRMETHATVRSDPEGLKSFLPPIPTELSTRQQNTVTVRAVHPEGTADVEARFDQFELHSNLTDRLPEKDRSSAQQAEQEFSRRVAGQTLTGHYNQEGRLISFEGGDAVLDAVDAPLREPLRQILKFFLEQMGGDALYPDHGVKPGEEWKRNLASPASDLFPFAAEGESTLRYVGKTRYHGVKAAIVDYHFINALKPALASSRQPGPLAALEAMGIALDLGVEGRGEGRALLAFDDGRVLQNRSTMHQTLTARLNRPQQISPQNAQPITLQVDSETSFKVDGRP